MNFYGFCKNRFPIWVATQNDFGMSFKKKIKKRDLIAIFTSLRAKMQFYNFYSKIAQK